MTDWFTSKYGLQQFRSNINIYGAVSTLYCNRSCTLITETTYICTSKCCWYAWQNDVVIQDKNAHRMDSQLFQYAYQFQWTDSIFSTHSALCWLNSNDADILEVVFLSLSQELDSSEFVCWELHWTSSDWSYVNFVTILKFIFLIVATVHTVVFMKFICVAVFRQGE